MPPDLWKVAEPAMLVIVIFEIKNLFFDQESPAVCHFKWKSSMVSTLSKNYQCLLILTAWKSFRNFVLTSNTPIELAWWWQVAIYNSDRLIRRRGFNRFSANFGGIGKLIHKGWWSVLSERRRVEDSKWIAFREGNAIPVYEVCTTSFPQSQTLSSSPRRANAERKHIERSKSLGILKFMKL